MYLLQIILPYIILQLYLCLVFIFNRGNHGFCGAF